MTAKPIEILHEDDEMIVIEKPAGVPAHPSGRYSFNSVIEIMRAERGDPTGLAGSPPLLPCNRLDRLTSGVMFVAKKSHAAERLSSLLAGRQVRKEYVARVLGEFPAGETVCEQPILLISPKLGLNRVRANGKLAKTVFERIAFYDSAEEEEPSLNPLPELRKDEARPAVPWNQHRGFSIVRCRPLTGRTHQIRVHLQFLGHPIANDPIYCNQRVFGANLGAGDDEADSDEDIIARLSRMGKSDTADAVAYHTELVDAYQRTRAEKMTGGVCSICGTDLYSDPGPHELGIYLHARCYGDADGTWEYQASMPEWALPPEADITSRPGSEP